MKSRLKGKKKHSELKTDLEVQQKALQKIIGALEERNSAGDMEKKKSSKTNKHEKN